MHVAFGRSSLPGERRRTDSAMAEHGTSTRRREPAPRVGSLTESRHRRHERSLGGGAKNTRSFSRGPRSASHAPHDSRPGEASQATLRYLGVPGPVLIEDTAASLLWLAPRHVENIWRAEPARERRAALPQLKVQLSARMPDVPKSP